MWKSRWRLGPGTNKNKSSRETEGLQASSQGPNPPDHFAFLIIASSAIDNYTATNNNELIITNKH